MLLAPFASTAYLCLHGELNHSLFYSCKVFFSLKVHCSFWHTITLTSQWPVQTNCHQQPCPIATFAWVFGAFTEAYYWSSKNNNKNNNIGRRGCDWNTGLELSLTGHIKITHKSGCPGQSGTVGNPTNTWWQAAKQDTFSRLHLCCQNLDLTVCECKNVCVFRQFTVLVWMNAAAFNK